MSALNCSRLQCSAICKNVASAVVAVHNARPSPRVRQPVSSTCTAPWSSTQSCKWQWGRPMRLRRAGRSRQPRRCRPRRQTDPDRARRSRGGRSDAGRSTSPPPPEPRPERRSANLRQPGAGPCATVPAAQLMGAMLGHDHADRRQLAHLMATEPPVRPALPIIEPASASATRSG